MLYSPPALASACSSQQMLSFNSNANSFSELCMIKGIRHSPLQFYIWYKQVLVTIIANMAKIRRFLQSNILVQCWIANGPVVSLLKRSTAQKWVWYVIWACSCSKNYLSIMAVWSNLSYIMKFLLRLGPRSINSEQWIGYIGYLSLLTLA